MNYDKLKEIPRKSVFTGLNMVYLVCSLAIPWYNSIFYMKNNGVYAQASVVIGYFISVGMMWLNYKITPNTKSFKDDISKEFFSHHSLIKSGVIYILSIILLSSPGSQSFGTALLIPYYMFVINFYTSTTSGEIKKGWF